VKGIRDGWVGVFVSTIGDVDGGRSITDRRGFVNVSGAYEKEGEKLGNSYYHSNSPWPLWKTYLKVARLVEAKSGLEN
jgi:hypothetical protein